MGLERPHSVYWFRSCLVFTVVASLLLSRGGLAHSNDGGGALTGEKRTAAVATLLSRNQSKEKCSDDSKQITNAGDIAGMKQLLQNMGANILDLENQVLAAENQVAAALKPPTAATPSTAANDTAGSTGTASAAGSPAATGGSTVSAAAPVSSDAEKAQEERQRQQTKIDALLQTARREGDAAAQTQAALKDMIQRLCNNSPEELNHIAKQWTDLEELIRAGKEVTEKLNTLRAQLQPPPPEEKKEEEAKEEEGGGGAGGGGGGGEGGGGMMMGALGGGLGGGGAPGKTAAATPPKAITDFKVGELGKGVDFGSLASPKVGYQLSPPEPTKEKAEYRGLAGIESDPSPEIKEKMRKFFADKLVEQARRKTSKARPASTKTRLLRAG